MGDEKGGVDARKFIRIPVALSIQFRRLEDFQEFVQADALDLSQGGVFVRTDVPRPVGTQVIMQIPVPGGEVIQLRGMVKHIRYNPEAPGNPPLGMGIEFTDLREDEKKFILGLLEKHQT